MGHIVDYFTASRKEDIIPKAIEWCSYNGDREEGSDCYDTTQMHITDRVYDSYEEALDAIEKMYQGKWYYDVAVRYHAKEELVPTAKEIALRKRIKKMYEDKNKYYDAHKLTGRRSSLIGCETCGSKISLDYLKAHPLRWNGYECPVCGESLAPQYVKDRLAKYDADIHNLENQATELVKTRKGKTPVRWLVKVECHC